VIGIILNSDGKIWIESPREGISETDASMHPARTQNLIGTVAASLNGVVHPQNPIVEGEIPLTGSRFEGLLPPIAPSPYFVIRKRAALIYTLDDYLKEEILTLEQVKPLRDAIVHRRNIVVAGGTGSGKTTIVSAVAGHWLCLKRGTPGFREEQPPCMPKRSRGAARASLLSST
jgi:type IV secretion system protein TrbB